jgi:hypothetical protein
LIVISELFDGVDACAFCGDPVGCVGRCTEVVEARIREFRELREARGRVVDEEAPLFAPVHHVIRAIQLGQVAAYKSLLADKETGNE